METIDISIDFVKSFIDEVKLNARKHEALEHLQALKNKTGKGNDFLGWVDLPETITSEELKKIEHVANEIRKKIDILVVVGIGGSYLGARAVIEMLNHNFNHILPQRERPIILYAGQNMGEDYLYQLLEVLNDYDYAITVISKSGTTTEPAIAFRLLKHHIENKYGKEEARKRIVAITDKEKGVLLELAKTEGYERFSIPDDVGGRYSVLTAVGLFPIAVAGGNIFELINGAKQMRHHIFKSSDDDNPAIAYALARNALYESGKFVEIMVSYTPRMHYFMEWWKQLYGESEGKENKGIFPASVDYTTDLHSLGQYVQDGKRMLFETVLSVKNPLNHLAIPHDPSNNDKLNFISYKRLSYVNEMARLGTLLAHIDGGVPNIIIEIPTINENYIGQLIYFFEIACGVSGYLLGVNPFDQPGVEAYKKNMFALMQKPGMEEESKAIQQRIENLFNED
ncbi:MAG TPA: glucose-6-phosphate isomerase [Bacteroidales bacterium]|jgi:glucose-6-phosphate isomerase|nr:glucose-6-phosphate isomerase [Bacteroidales bacterium]HOU98479.1 glucose-6-phosphate isomerase [Bacteroidales bacterium]